MNIMYTYDFTMKLFFQIIIILKNTGQYKWQKISDEDEHCYKAG